MTRVITIVLIVAIALQTVGCAPTIRMRKFSLDSSQDQIRKDAQQILKKGMQATIFLRRNARVPFSGRILECVIERAGTESLIVTVKPKYLAIGSARRYAFTYSDIMTIRYHEPDDQRNLRTLLVVATVVGVVLFIVGIKDSFYMD